MILPYLNAIDSTLLNTYIDFNLSYLNDLKVNIYNPTPYSTYLNNILAKDDLDPYKVAPGEASAKLHSALCKLIDRTYFFNQEEKSELNALLTYILLSPNPNLEQVTFKLSQLQEIHKDLTEIEVGDDGIIIYAKMLYNRSRMLALQDRGLKGVELELTTDFDKMIDVVAVADMMSRMNNIHNPLKYLKVSVIPNLHDKDICAMIRDVCEAMLTYRSALISPEKAGLGTSELAASELALLEREPTPSVRKNLQDTLDKYSEMNLAFTPADFLLSLNEGIRLSGMYLMV